MNLSISMITIQASSYQYPVRCHTQSSMRQARLRDYSNINILNNYNQICNTPHKLATIAGLILVCQKPNDLNARKRNMRFIATPKVLKYFKPYFVKLEYLNEFRNTPLIISF